MSKCNLSSMPRSFTRLLTRRGQKASCCSKCEIQSIRRSQWQYFSCTGSSSIH